ncbi:hypothetical protein VTN49DRAFT_5027 [Thermomyces lanuginosus]|uniref:uncharacterized protein n=1 Tax=Thermomyces lanuginosus TaxID=5541 RepID=UPI003742EBC2
MLTRRVDRNLPLNSISISLSPGMICYPASGMKHLWRISGQRKQRSIHIRIPGAQPERAVMLIETDVASAEQKA